MKCKHCGQAIYRHEHEGKVEWCSEHTPTNVCPANAAGHRPKAWRPARAVGYVVRPHGAYPDDPAGYVTCATRAEVEGQLVDYGWLDNPGVWVYKVRAGVTAEDVIAELVVDPDPYPDWVVERGPRGGVQWNKA